MNTTPRIPRAALAALAGALLLSACAVPVVRSTRVIDAPPREPRVALAPPPPPPPPVVVQYGTVVRIEETDTRVPDTGGGAALGALIGGVVGNQFGHGMGRAAATGLGIFGGAVVGDNVERANGAAASHTVFHVYVRFDDGSERRFDYRGLGGLRTGERVRLEGDRLERG